MDTYKQLQGHIKQMDDDYNKDEEVLLLELRQLESRNKESIRNYREVKN